MKAIEPWTDGNTMDLIRWYSIYPDDFCKTMRVITHSRRNFYEMNNPIYWYEFISGESNVMLDSIMGKFLRVPGTKYYEYGGYHADAIKELTKAGIADIVNGKEI